MNKIRQLFDEKYVIDLFSREVLPHYPAFVSISRVEIRPYKELVWETTYHVVIGFNTYFLKASGEEDKIPIVCSAHSSEPRENVYLALKYLWAQGFPTDEIDLPDPLFYSEEFRGTFYRGLKGENLLYYIDQKDTETVAAIVARSGRLFARLHALPASTAANFNPLNSRILTVTPGLEKTLTEMGWRYQNKYNADLENIYRYLTAREDQFFHSGERLALIHGDAHAENIIQTGDQRIGLIDFTDLCLGDYARDIGCFLQQLEHKIYPKVGGSIWAAEVKKIFLTSYWEASGRSWSPAIQERIDLYYNWTMVRTAVYWFLRFEPNAGQAAKLLESVKTNLQAHL